MTRRLVLAGGGHAHAEVLRQWAQYPIPDVDLVVISPQAMAPYSGMVPGWLAGYYRYENICVPFGALAARARARLAVGELHALDPDHKTLIMDTGEVVRYDVLSLNVGSTVSPPALPAGARLMALRPLGRLQKAWDGLLAELTSRPLAPGTVLRVAVVGGGAAAVEGLLAVLSRLRLVLPHCEVRSRLVARSDTLLPGLAQGAAKAAARELQAAGVQVQLGADFDPASVQPGEIVLWATGAEAHAWQRDAQRRGSLAVSEAGFVRVDTYLRSLSHRSILAVGDCAEWSPPLPKSGVHAVRMGVTLTTNLRVAFGYGRPVEHRPQKRSLALLALGDRHALAARGGWSVGTPWLTPFLWDWKDRIDRRFVSRYALSKLSQEG